ncbi:uncharacterized protein SPSK_09423 [Sporothrix schenckii 1099-18]|uniref:Uncharacterized protein n=1 Tax=Sporothrix schenckii 1099-18 TaxID=1397361 RepID=A0A0F2M8J5_SPOSC|nr:uncharacterized protein SPSK_09423 [Sporothrix schenckii 1099-18]KJR85429.1 hypothetical protein SPSK_09423 [Sporothrix schenckii 1099-18]
MIRLNPTALSVTVEDVNNLVVRRGSSSDDSETQTTNHIGQQISKQSVFDSSEEQPPYTAAQASASPTAASTKDGQPDALPLQARAEPEMDDSYMEDVPHPVPALTETRTRGGNSSKNSQTAGDSEAGHAAELSEDVNMATPHQHGQVLAHLTPSQNDAPAQVGPYDDNASPRWLSLPPRRPHPAWAAAERETATSPLANRPQVDRYPETSVATGPFSSPVGTARRRSIVTPEHRRPVRTPRRSQSHGDDLEAIDRRAAKEKERGPEHFEQPPRAHKQPDVFPPTGRDREPADFKIFEEPSRVVRVSRREFEQFFGRVNAGSDDDVPDVLEEVV